MSFAKIPKTSNPWNKLVINNFKCTICQNIPVEYDTWYILSWYEWRNGYCSWCGRTIFRVKMADSIDVDPSMREYGENLTMQERLTGHCSCGSVRYESECGGKLWGVFFCHCSMCPTSEAESHGGVGWAAIPRPKYFGSILEKSSSNFSTRGLCMECNGAIFIRYHCEDYTDWVLFQTLHPKPNHST